MADLLRTDYKDDILNTDVNTQRKYRMVQNNDGTVSFEDVTAYEQVGDNFGAADINKTNLAIDELNNALDSKTASLENQIYNNISFQALDVQSNTISSTGVLTMASANSGDYVGTLKDYEGIFFKQSGVYLVAAQAHTRGTNNVIIDVELSTDIGNTWTLVKTVTANYGGAFICFPLSVAPAGVVDWKTRFRFKVRENTGSQETDVFCSVVFLSKGR